MGRDDEPKPCGTCGGSGTIDHWVEDKDGNMRNNPQSCHACGGSGSR